MYEKYKDYCQMNSMISIQFFMPDNCNRIFTEPTLNTIIRIYYRTFIYLCQISYLIN
jgi:hypothetical protein